MSRSIEFYTWLREQHHDVVRFAVAQDRGRREIPHLFPERQPRSDWDREFAIFRQRGGPRVGNHDAATASP